MSVHVTLTIPNDMAERFFDGHLSDEDLRYVTAKIASIVRHPANPETAWLHETNRSDARESNTALPASRAGDPPRVLRPL